MKDLRKLVTDKINNAAFHGAFAVSGIDEIMSLFQSKVEEIKLYIATHHFPPDETSTAYREGYEDAATDLEKLLDERLKEML